jgi:hypothetical protein
VTSDDWAGAALLVGWLAWAVVWALALRFVLAALVRRLLPRSLWMLTGLLVYVAVVGVFAGSMALHLAVLGPANMYGATTQQAFSLIAYTVAPFGLPLLVGSIVLLPWDLANCIIRPRGWVR